MSTLVLAARFSHAETITSQALTSEDISDTVTGQGALQSSPTSGAPAIHGVTTTLITGVGNGSDPSVMTYRVTGNGFDFTYDLMVSAYASEAGVETLVNRRNNSGRIMPDSRLAGEHRQRIDSPDTVGDRNWEFLRLELGNVQLAEGSVEVSLLGFNAVRLDGLGNAGNEGNVEDAPSGEVIGTWEGGVDNGSGGTLPGATIDLTADYPTAIDLVATGTSGDNNANRPMGFAADFQVGAAPSGDLQITEVSLDPETKMITLTWVSRESASYTLQESAALGLSEGGWVEVEDAIPGMADQTTHTFSPSVENRELSKLFFRIIEE